MTPLSVAIIGAGSMGCAHADAVSAARDHVAVVVDADFERAKLLAARSGGRAAELIESIGSVDAAVITTPTVLHLSQAVELISMGVSVLVEKPHRLPGESAVALRNALAGSDAHYQVGMSTRFQTGISETARLIRTGRLGRVVAVTDQIWFSLGPADLPAWYFDPSSAGGGVVLTNGVHALDRANWMLGEPLRLVDAELHPIIAGHRTEDHASIRCRGEVTAATVDVSLLWTDIAAPGSEFRVVGTNGVARVGEDDWMITTRTGVFEGRAEHPSMALRRQWTDFAGRVRGNISDGGHADIDELEPTLCLIEEIYDRAQRP